MNNSRPAWALAFVRSQLFARAVRFALPIMFVPRLENFFDSLSLARRRRRRQPRERIKKRIKIARLVIFSSRIPPTG
jgi:hypothetical protein